MNGHAATACVWGVIPAAGEGRRMGQPKQVMPYRGSTFVGTVARTVLDAGAEGLVVVTRSSLERELDLPDDPRVRIVFNDRGGTEMVDSIRVGLAALARASSETAVSPPLRAPLPRDGIMIVPADMPALSVEACRVCIHAYVNDSGRIVIASHGQRRGHPIIFPFSLRSSIDGLTGGLNELPRIYRELVRFVDVADSSATRDVDTMDDYDDLASGSRADDEPMV